MQHQASQRAQLFARTLRRGMTDAEQAVWRGLRGEQLGVKFRRQHPQGNFIADFACLAPRLILEIDGSQHAGQQAYDRQRDDFFKSLGFEVLRFHANEALSNTQGVLLVVLERLQHLQAAAAPIPTFPQRGKELESKALVEQDRLDAGTSLLLPPLGEGRDGGSANGAQPHFSALACPFGE